MFPAGRSWDWTDGWTSVSPQHRDFAVLWYALTWLNARASYFKSLPGTQIFFYTSVFPTFWLHFTPWPSTYTHTQLQQYFYLLSAKHGEIFSFIKTQCWSRPLVWKLSTILWKRPSWSPQVGGHVKKMKVHPNSSFWFSFTSWSLSNSQPLPTSSLKSHPLAQARVSPACHFSLTRFPLLRENCFIYPLWLSIQTVTFLRRPTQVQPALDVLSHVVLFLFYLPELNTRSCTWWHRFCLALLHVWGHASATRSPAFQWL